MGAEGKYDLRLAPSELEGSGVLVHPSLAVATSGSPTSSPNAPLVGNDRPNRLSRAGAVHLPSSESGSNAKNAAAGGSVLASRRKCSSTPSLPQATTDPPKTSVAACDQASSDDNLTAKVSWLVGSCERGAGSLMWICPPTVRPISFLGAAGGRDGR